MEPTYSDRALLGGVPDYLSINGMLKARPATEGADRFVFIEASNESLDQQGEVVLAKALADSADYFLRFGNLDIDHYTQIGAKAGIPAYETYEIGRPVEVRADAGATFVKGQIYSGSGPAAERANAFWSSLTDISPPSRWYPSVGGAVIAKSVVVDPDTKMRKAIIDKVRWTNIGFSKTPVNAQVPTAQTVPFGALAKSMCACGGWDMCKALEAGYGTDSAALTDGGALRVQSLYPVVYADFRDWLAEQIRQGKVGSSPAGMVEMARERFDLSLEAAFTGVHAFLADLESSIKVNQR